MNEIWDASGTAGKLRANRLSLDVSWMRRRADDFSRQSVPLTGRGHGRGAGTDGGQTVVVHVRETDVVTENM